MTLMQMQRKMLVFVAGVDRKGGKCWHRAELEGHRL